MRKSKERKQLPQNSDPHASPVFFRVMQLLEEWSWESGLDKLEEQRLLATSQKDKDLFVFFIGWMAGERGHHGISMEYLSSIRESSFVSGYAQAGLAAIAYRERRIVDAETLLDNITRRRRSSNVLIATTLHLRGLICMQKGDPETAHNLLNLALEKFGPDHFGSGRVLDSVGSLYVQKNRLHAAEQFFAHALRVKKLNHDAFGLAVSYGQLARVHLDWGNLDTADAYARKNIDLCERLGDVRGLAQMYNLLGQLFEQRDRFDKALAYLEESKNYHVALGQSRLSALNLKDLALVLTRLVRLAEAEECIRNAREIFLGVDDAFAMAHLNRVHGIVLRCEEKNDQSLRELRKSVSYFEMHQLPAEAARSRLEIGRTLIAGKAAPALVTDALAAALDSAERALRPNLIKQVSELLRRHDEAEFSLREYRKVRGLGVTENTVDPSPKTEFASIMFLDIRDYTGYVRNEEPSIVMSTLNQIFSEMATVLEEYDVVVNQYLGDGFMAIARNSAHAVRSVTAGIQLISAFHRINHPRQVLGLPPLQCRIGVSTGAVVLGNVGTYRKLDFTAVGPTTNLAARLQSEAHPGSVCICETTYPAICRHSEFVFQKPRKVDLKGFGVKTVWDVTHKT